MLENYLDINYPSLRFVNRDHALKLLKFLPDDGDHSVSEKMPEPGVMLHIDCVEPVGGCACLGKDGKWYWAYDWQQDVPCKATVKSWCYFGYPGPDEETIEYLREKYEED